MMMVVFVCNFFKLLVRPIHPKNLFSWKFWKDWAGVCHKILCVYKKKEGGINNKLIAKLKTRI